MRAGLAFGFALVPAALIAAPTVEKTKNVDIALCLDTSSSMDGLIESAKRQLWAVVNDVAKIEPTPTLRVSLYSYGNNTYDASRGYVRREADLTTDLDEIYKRINALGTTGAGSNEYAARVSHYALTELKWSEDKESLRLLFVCGNEEVDQDHEVSLESIAEVAKSKGIIVNTIFCGSASLADVAGWSAFAKRCGGKFANIDQERARVEAAIKTPFDAEIEKLGTQINKTYVWYGVKGNESAKNQTLQDSNAKRAADSVAAERSITKATSLYRNAECDLIDRMQTDKTFDLKKLKDEELPDELRKLKLKEREPYVKKKAAERQEIKKKVAQLAARRALFIEEVRAKQSKSPGDKALDEALRAILREQARNKGMKIKE